MAEELAPRLLLTQILRVILVVFAISAQLNVQTYIGDIYVLSNVYSSLIISWIVVGWNTICVLAAAVHPYLQRFAKSLPFPVTVAIRGRTILSYGDSQEDGDGLFAPVAGRLVLSFVDAVLATHLVVFSTLARDLERSCEKPNCLGGRLHVQGWIINAWLTIVIIEYVLVLVQGCEALGIWYNRRYLAKRGRISLA